MLDHKLSQRAKYSFARNRDDNNSFYFLFSLSPIFHSVLFSIFIVRIYPEQMLRIFFCCFSSSIINNRPSSNNRKQNKRHIVHWYIMSRESIWILGGPVFSEVANSFDRVPQIKRTQQILLFLISIVFVRVSIVRNRSSSKTTFVLLSF